MFGGGALDIICIFDTLGITVIFPKKYRGRYRKREGERQKEIKTKGRRGERERKAQTD